jgi:hypothetical protein
MGSGACDRFASGFWSLGSGGRRDELVTDYRFRRYVMLLGGWARARSQESRHGPRALDPSRRGVLTKSSKVEGENNHRAAGIFLGGPVGTAFPRVRAWGSGGLIRAVNTQNHAHGEVGMAGMVGSWLGGRNGGRTGLRTQAWRAREVVSRDQGGVFGSFSKVSWVKTENANGAIQG